MLMLIQLDPKALEVIPVAGLGKNFEFVNPEKKHTPGFSFPVEM